MQKYSIDTSAILDAWVRYYPHDTFPSFWNRFKTLAESQEVIATELIEHELSKKDDGCHKWFKQNNRLFFCSEAVTTAYQMVYSDPIPFYGELPCAIYPAHFFLPYFFKVKWEGRIPKNGGK